jgi:hypothetical protein
VVYVDARLETEQTCTNQNHTKISNEYVTAKKSRRILRGSLDSHLFIVMFCQTWKGDWTGAVVDRSHGYDKRLIDRVACTNVLWWSDQLITCRFWVWGGHQSLGWVVPSPTSLSSLGWERFFFGEEIKCECWTASMKNLSLWVVFIINVHQSLRRGHTFICTTPHHMYIIIQNQFI